MLLQRLSRVALFFTSVAVVNKCVGEVFRLNMVANIASAGVGEGSADVTGVPKVAPFNELVQLSGAAGHKVQPYQEGSNQYESAETPLPTF